MSWIDRRKKIEESAEAIKRIIRKNAGSFSDDDVKDLPQSVFPQWQSGMVYEAKDVVVYNGVTYRVSQKHTSQANWLPDAVPSLYDKFKLVDTGGGEVIEEWQQTYAHNAYMKGKKVLYNGKIYESLIDNNSWSPDAYPQGWKIIT